MTLPFGDPASTVPFADPSAYDRQLHEELGSVFRRVVADGTYILGPELGNFERDYASYVEAEHCVGVGNGFDALVLGLRAIGVTPGDEVLVPSNTFVATWLAVSAVGALPVGVEPDEGSQLIDPGRLEAAVTPRTRAVVPVHLHGQPADMDPIMAWAGGHRVAVLADAAQAHGARYRGRGLGALGAAVAWSFYPTKNLGALGDGGAVTTDDPELAERVRCLRNYGSLTRDDHKLRGVNSRLDELQAALLRVKLRHLDAWNGARREQAERYRLALARDHIGVALPNVAATNTAVWHHFVLRCADRDRVRDHLANNGVEALVHYPTPPFAQPAYADLGTGPASFPIARRLASEVLSLPMGLHLTHESQDRVIEVLHGALTERT